MWSLPFNVCILCAAQDHLSIYRDASLLHETCNYFNRVPKIKFLYDILTKWPLNWVDHQTVLGRSHYCKFMTFRSCQIYSHGIYHILSISHHPKYPKNFQTSGPQLLILYFFLLPYHFIQYFIYKEVHSKNVDYWMKIHLVLTVLEGLVDTS